MTATLEDITGWFKAGKDTEDVTHLIVTHDTWDHENYPVYVTIKEDVKEVCNKCLAEDYTKIEEVFSYKYSIESQLKEQRAFHLD